MAGHRYGLCAGSPAAVAFISQLTQAGATMLLSRLRPVGSAFTSKYKGLKCYSFHDQYCGCIKLYPQKKEPLSSSFKTDKVN